jgi:hypothetical protein
MPNSKKKSMIFCAIALVVFFVDSASAETYYGSQLMPPQERAEHRDKMRNLPPSEREAYRTQHHEAMKERAESMGLSIPDQPPAYRGFGRRGLGYGYGRGGRGYWVPGYRRGNPWYGGPGYDVWRDRGDMGLDIVDQPIQAGSHKSLDSAQCAGHWRCDDI